MAIFLSATAVEMALQERFPEKRGKGLKKLLQTAKETGLLHDDGFPSLKYRSENTAMPDEQISGSMIPRSQPEEPYVNVVIETFPKIRNRFAHPEMHAIIPPA
jgi:hypothetical protein